VSIKRNIQIKEMTRTIYAQMVDELTVPAISYRIILKKNKQNENKAMNLRSSIL